VFDDPVVALGAAVADAGDQAFDDGGLPGVHGPRQPPELGDPGVRAVGVEVGEPLPDQAPVRSTGARQGEQVAPTVDQRSRGVTATWPSTRPWSWGLPWSS